MSSPSSPRPGDIRLSCPDGVVHSTKIEVFGQDSAWHPLRCVTAVRVTASAADKDPLVRATVELDILALAGWDQLVQSERVALRLAGVDDLTVETAKQLALLGRS